MDCALRMTLQATRSLVPACSRTSLVVIGRLCFRTSKAPLWLTLTVVASKVTGFPCSATWMLARTRRKTRWPRRRSSPATAAVETGLGGENGFAAVSGFEPLAAGLTGLVECFDGIGVAIAADFATGTLKDSIFKARHPRNRSPLLLIQPLRPTRPTAASPSRRHAHPRS